MAASTTSETACAKRKRLSRTIEKEERQVLSGLSNMFDDETEVDLKYVISELEGPKKHHIGRVARLLRKGLLDKLDGLDDEAENVPDKVVKFKHLRQQDLVSFVSAFEPRADTTTLESLSRATLLRWVCFALHVKESTDLPSEFPTLRQWTPLKEYLKIAYNTLGRRLQAIVGATTLREDTIAGFFSIDMRSNRVYANTATDEAGATLFIDVDLNGATDWTIEKPFSRDAVLKSATLDCFTKLAGRLQKTKGTAIPPEGAGWDLPSQLPRCIIGDGQIAGAGQAAPAGSGSVAPPLPPGDGLAEVGSAA